MIKFIIFIIFNIILAFLGYRWFQTNVDMPSLIENIKDINTRAILISGIPGVAVLLMYGYRMKFFISRSFPSAFVISIMGHGFNNLFPFRLGEFARVMLARRFYRVSVYDLGVTIILEKSFDLICIGFLALVAFYFISHLEASVWLLVGLGIAVACISAAIMQVDFSKYIAKDSRLSKYFLKLNEAIRYSHLREKLFSVTFSSVLLWSCLVSQFYLYFTISLPSVSFTLLDAIALSVITAVTFVVPLTISSIGVFEGSVIYYLHSQHSIPMEQSLVLASVLHLAMVLPQVAGTFLSVLYKEVERLFQTSRQRTTLDVVVK